MCVAPGMVQTELGGEDTWQHWGHEDPLKSDDGR